MPGLGESIARAKELAELYDKHLPDADVILWVHPVVDRMLEFSQRKVTEIFREELGPLADHLVFGLNKADDMYPKNWRQHANVPSEEQLRNLEDAERNFANTMREVLPRRTPLRLTTYSALQYYNLARLFALLMEAMPKKRRWVLEQRMDLADFIQKADPRFVAEVAGTKPARPTAPHVPPREWIVSRMTDQDLRTCVLSGLTPEQWWQRRELGEIPFPQCPSCGRKWAYSYHYQCRQGGQVEVDPDARRVRCASCRESWSVWDNKFICACTHTFRTADVRAAIDDIIATASLFARIVEDNRREAMRARSLGENSMREWIQGIATIIGGRLGGLLGTIAGAVARKLFGAH